MKHYLKHDCCVLLALFQQHLRCVSLRSSTAGCLATGAEGTVMRRPAAAKLERIVAAQRDARDSHPLLPAYSFPPGHSSMRHAILPPLFAADSGSTPAHSELLLVAQPPPPVAAIAVPVRPNAAGPDSTRTPDCMLGTDVISVRPPGAPEVSIAIVLEYCCAMCCSCAAGRPPPLGSAI